MFFRGGVLPGKKKKKGVLGGYLPNQQREPISCKAFCRIFGNLQSRKLNTNPSEHTIHPTQVDEPLPVIPSINNTVGLRRRSFHRRVIDSARGLASWHAASALCSKRAVAKVNHNTLIKDKGLRSHHALPLASRFLRHMYVNVPFSLLAESLLLCT